MTTRVTVERTKWALAHKLEIEGARSIIGKAPRGGSNAANISGYSGPGWGWWANALDAAGINPNRCSYWSGSNPTPSTAINGGIAKYIRNNF
jgi:hypothetical protein